MIGNVPAPGHMIRRAVWRHQYLIIDKLGPDAALGSSGLLLKCDQLSKIGQFCILSRQVHRCKPLCHYSLIHANVPIVGLIICPNKCQQAPKLVLSVAILIVSEINFLLVAVFANICLGLLGIWLIF